MSGTSISGAIARANACDVAASALSALEMRKVNPVASLTQKQASFSGNLSGDFVISKSMRSKLRSFITKIYVHTQLHQLGMASAAMACALLAFVPDEDVKVERCG